MRILGIVFASILLTACKPTAAPPKFDGTDILDKVMTAPANREVTVSTVALPLTDVTYVEGTSRMQDWLMRSSGMQGMVGNTLFLGRKLTLDAGTQKFKVE